MPRGGQLHTYRDWIEPPVGQARKGLTKRPDLREHVIMVPFKALPLRVAREGVDKG